MVAICRRGKSVVFEVKIINDHIVAVQNSELLLDEDAECLEYYFSKFNNLYSHNNEKNHADISIYLKGSLLLSSGLAINICGNKYSKYLMCALLCVPLLYKMYCKQRVESYSKNIKLLIKKLFLVHKQNKSTLKYLQKMLHTTDNYHKDLKSTLRSSLLSEYFESKELFYHRLTTVTTELLLLKEKLINKSNLVLHAWNPNEIRNCLNKITQSTDMDNLISLTELYILVTSNFLTILGLSLLPNARRVNYFEPNHLEYVFNYIITKSIAICEEYIKEIQNGNLLRSLTCRSKIQTEYIKRKMPSISGITPLYNALQDVTINCQLNFIKSLHLIECLEQMEVEKNKVMLKSVGQLLEELKIQHNDTGIALDASLVYFNKTLMQIQNTLPSLLPNTNIQKCNEKMQPIPSNINELKPAVEFPQAIQPYEEIYELFISNDCDNDEDTYIYEDEQDIQSLEQAKALIVELKNTLKKINLERYGTGHSDTDIDKSKSRSLRTKTQNNSEIISPDLLTDNNSIKMVTFAKPISEVRLFERIDQDVETGSSNTGSSESNNRESLEPHEMPNSFLTELFTKMHNFSSRPEVEYESEGDVFTEFNNDSQILTTDHSNNVGE